MNSGADLALLHTLRQRRHARCLRELAEAQRRVEASAGALAQAMAEHDRAAAKVSEVWRTTVRTVALAGALADDLRQLEGAHRLAAAAAKAEGSRLSAARAGHQLALCQVADHQARTVQASAAVCKLEQLRARRQAAWRGCVERQESERLDDAAVQLWRAWPAADPGR